MDREPLKQIRIQSIPCRNRPKTRFPVLLNQRLADAFISPAPVLVNENICQYFVGATLVSRSKVRRKEHGHPFGLRNPNGNTGTELPFLHGVAMLTSTRRASSWSLCRFHAGSKTAEDEPDQWRHGAGRLMPK